MAWRNHFVGNAGSRCGPLRPPKKRSLLARPRRRNQTSWGECASGASLQARFGQIAWARNPAQACSCSKHTRRWTFGCVFSARQNCSRGKKLCSSTSRSHSASRTNLRLWAGRTSESKSPSIGNRGEGASGLEQEIEAQSEALIGQLLALAAHPRARPTWE